MFSGLMKALRQLLGESFARMLSGAGMTVVTYAALIPVIQGGLAAAVSSFGSIGAVTAALIYKSGIGVALSGIGTAMMVRAAMQAGKASLGVKK